jgi:hypothetical protein
MKKLAFISGAVFSAATVLGIVLKMGHWPGAMPLLVCGLIGISFVFIPSYTKYQFSKNK